VFIIIGFIGAGKVGMSLGIYLSSRGIKITGYFSKSEASSREASMYTASKNYLNLKELIKDSKGIYITTPDDEIEAVAEKLSKFQLQDKIICHASGSLGSKVLNRLKEKGGYIYSIHPLYPFSNKYTSYKGLENAYFSIEGDEKYLTSIKSFIENLGNKVIILPRDSKALYHLSCVAVSNFVLSIIDIGCKYLESCGVESKAALNSLMPLIENNLENIKKTGINASLTGPIERGDLKTIKAHLDIIPKEQRMLYKALSLNLLNIAKTNNKNRDYTEIEKYLFEEDI
jgi:predicted short-subunit dehydrogenase-like oxidoreductase (DUF2520 family)